jgi:hypothetical protein
MSWWCPVGPASWSLNGDMSWLDVRSRLALATVPAGCVVLQDELLWSVLTTMTPPFGPHEGPRSRTALTSVRTGALAVPGTVPA